MRWILAVVAVGLAALAGLTFAKADSGLQIHDTTIRGVPLREIRQSESAGLAPGVVVAHGFAGSARLMAGFGDTLARRGFVVVLLDFSGHGASRHGPPTAETLVSDLDTAVGYLRSLPNVDPKRLSLGGGGFWGTAAIFAVVIVVLTAAALTGVAPGFLVLIVPLLAVLLMWQAGWTAVLARLAAPPWLIALVGAILPAWPLAVALPLLS